MLQYTHQKFYMGVLIKNNKKIIVLYGGAQEILILVKICTKWAEMIHKGTNPCYNITVVYFLYNVVVFGA